MAKQPAPSPLVSDDRRTALKGVRDELARRLPACEDKSAAGIAKQLLEVQAELAGMPTEQEVDPVDDVAARRAHRRSNSKAG